MAEFWPQIISVISFFLLFRITTSDKTVDINQLISFKSNIADPLGSLSSWNANSSRGPCDTPHWNGITCTNGSVFGLQLENMSLSGQLKLDPLTTLPLLRTLSFLNNSFTGSLPDLSQFKGLKSVYFSMNKLSGNISDNAFDNMFSLKKVVLSMNQFSGLIPSSLTRVNSLLELWMDNNRFVGEIPDFRQTKLTIVNVVNNNLEGKIPDGLSKVNGSFFAGNKGLCGPPTTTSCSLVTTISAPNTSPPSLPTSSSSRKLSPGILAAIIVISIAMLLALLGASYAVIRYRKPQKAKETSQTPASQRPNTTQSVNRQRVEQGGTTTTTTVTQKKAMRGTVKEEREQGMLVLVNNRREGFELDDLLKASAEVLGSGELGSSYKALLLDGPSVVVKRFKGMNRLGKEEFEEHMRRIGRLSHPNLLPLVAYYYRREEKLLVTDFIPNGSLASLLHANRTADNRPLDWPTRLKIVKGIAGGLAYLHSELSSILTAPHGHLKSSNVLLTPTFSPVLSDYALLPLFHHPHSLAAFRSPESHRLSPKSDVWSLGVLILEILTGKLPDNYTASSSSKRVGGSGSELANWVNSVVREEWTGEVFDGEMRRTRDGEGEMLSLLQIGLGCCEGDVNKRWELSDAVEKIEELKERDDNEEYSSIGGMTTEDEGFSFSTNNPSWVS